MIFISLLILLNTGCAATDNLFARMANYYEQYQFNSDVADSQEKTQEARVLMAAGKFAPAKKALDEAFETYADQAALHEAYGQYYQMTNRPKFIKLAKARQNQMVYKSDEMLKKGQTAFDYHNYGLAGDLFKLSLIYNDKNTNTLLSMGALAYDLGDTRKCNHVIARLKSLNYESSKFAFFQYLVASRSGNKRLVAESIALIQDNYPNSAEYKLLFPTTSLANQSL